MITQNLHTHCDWDDGRNTIEDMIAAAKAAGLTSLGISVHAPVPYSSIGCPESRLVEFLKEMKSLKEEHNSDHFQLYVGAEWDIYSPKLDKETTREDGVIVPGLGAFDYVIGSVHALKVRRENTPKELLALFGEYDYWAIDERIKDVKYIVNFRFNGHSDEAVKHYFKQYEDVAKNKHVRIVGHFDLIKKFCKDYSREDQDYHVIDPDSEAYQKAAKEAIDLLIQADKIFELNTSILDPNDPENTAYPAFTLLKYIREKNGKVTVSSDAHRVSDIAREFKTAKELLKKAKFTEIWMFNGKDFVSQPL